MSTVNVTDQYAANSVSARSEFGDNSVPVVATALAHVGLPKLAMRTRSGQGVTLSELPVAGLLVLRAQKDKAALDSAVTLVIGIGLPSTLSSSEGTRGTSEAVCLRWIAPDEWLLSCDIKNAFDIETSLRQKLGDASVAIVNVSGGFTVLEMHGAHAIDVLKKSTAYDTHPTNFSEGKVINTVFAKAQVTMRCLGPAHYELIVRRSFADYLWHWIQVASSEYGLSIADRA